MQTTPLVVASRQPCGAGRHSPGTWRLSRTASGGFAGQAQAVWLPWVGKLCFLSRGFPGSCTPGLLGVASAAAEPGFELGAFLQGRTGIVQVAWSYSAENPSSWSWPLWGPSQNPKAARQENEQAMRSFQRPPRLDCTGGGENNVALFIPTPLSSLAALRFVPPPSCKFPLVPSRMGERKGLSVPWPLRRRCTESAQLGGLDKPLKRNAHKLPLWEMWQGGQKHPRGCSSFPARPAMQGLRQNRGGARGAPAPGTIPSWVATQLPLGFRLLGGQPQKRGRRQTSAGSCYRGNKSGSRVWKLPLPSSKPGSDVKAPHDITTSSDVTVPGAAALDPPLCREV